MLASKKHYKYFCRQTKSRHKHAQCRQMNDLSRKAPREFWKLFKQKSPYTNGENVSIMNSYKNSIVLKIRPAPIRNLINLFH